MSKRIELLKLLIKDRYKDSQADFARAIERSPAQVNQWLSGHRALGDAGCRNIELKLNLGIGYFDRVGANEDHASYTPPPTALPKREDADIAAVVKLMKGTDHAGRKMALAAVKVALADHKPVSSNAVK